MPTQQTGFFGWVSRRPKLAFWTTLAVALFIGIGIGAAGGEDRAATDTATGEDTAAQGKTAALTAERDQLRDQLARATDRTETAERRLKRLTAKAQVPDFTGKDYDDAVDNDLVFDLDWKLKRRSQITTAASPGTVMAQSPKEGKTLRAGRSITLVLARRPAPKPKQWVTIKTLQGASSTKTEEFRIPSGAKARLRYSMPQDSNNAITLYKAPKEYIDLLLNEIGPQQGSTRLYEPGTFYLDVTGSYTIHVQVFKRPA